MDEYRVKVWPTGISALDSLLQGGLPYRSMVLVTGHPGTGKTTLAWQLLHHAAETGIPGAFISFDENAIDSYERYRVSFAPDFTNVTPVSGKHQRSPSDRSVFIYNTPHLHLHGLKRSGEGRSAVEFEKLYAVAHNNGVLVIDGVSLLLDDAQDSDRARVGIFKEVLPRFKDALLHPREANHAYFPQLIICTAEAKTDRAAYAYDSYLADVIIETAITKYTFDSTQPNSSEILLSCQIPKARGVHVQRRAVCYEFVPGKGLEFFETYPAEGTLKLFYENEPQRRFIADFKRRDVPSLYPALNVSSFVRANLQHEYAIRRRARAIPRRRSMTMYHLDEYWVTSMRPLLQPIPLNKLTPYDGGKFGFIHELDRTHKKWIWEGSAQSSLYAVPHAGNIGLFVYRREMEKAAAKIVEGVPIFTWEGIREACLQSKRHLLLEMKTFDTVCVFFLELCWSLGGGWFTKVVKKGKREALQIEYRPGGGEDAVVEALGMLHQWIHKDKIVSPHATIDPRHHRAFEHDWLFARHWYSTLVDLLTYDAPRSKDKHNTGDSQSRRVKHRDIGVAPIPVPERRVEQIEAGAPCHSAWGEWYLGVWKGTENEALSHELVNTFISSASTITMARTGAGLPLIERFYSEFSNTRCFGTDLTYGQIRRWMFRGAFSRGQFNRYRYAMQRVFAGLTELISNASSDPGTIWKSIASQINDARF
jgi:RecA/RadA recombinase